MKQIEIEESKSKSMGVSLPLGLWAKVNARSKTFGRSIRGRSEYIRTLIEYDFAHNLIDIILQKEVNSSSLGQTNKDTKEVARMYGGNGPSVSPNKPPRKRASTGRENVN